MLCALIVTQASRKVRDHLAPMGLLDMRPWRSAEAFLLSSTNKEYGTICIWLDTSIAILITSIISQEMVAFSSHYG